MGDKRDDYEAPSFVSFTSPVKDEFVEKSQALKKSSLQLGREDLLQLYGLFKQTIYGDNTTDSPGAFSFYEKAKWSAWSGNKGKSQEEAATAYIAYANRFL